MDGGGAMGGGGGGRGRAAAGAGVGSGAGVTNTTSVHGLTVNPEHHTAPMLELCGRGQKHSSS